MPAVAPLIDTSKFELESRVKAPVSVRTPVAVVESPGLTVPAVVLIEPTVPIPPSVAPELTATSPATAPLTRSVPAATVVPPV